MGPICIVETACAGIAGAVIVAEEITLATASARDAAGPEAGD
jgi:hypothetical protein